MFKVRIASNTFEDTFISYVKRLGKGSFGLTSEPFKKISYKDAPSQNPGRIYYKAICEEDLRGQAETYILLEFDKTAGRSGLGAVFVTCGHDRYGEHETHGSVREPGYIDFVPDYQPIDFDDFKKHVESIVEEDYKGLDERIGDYKEYDVNKFHEYCEKLNIPEVKEPFKIYLEGYGFTSHDSEYVAPLEFGEKYHTSLRVTLNKDTDEVEVRCTLDKNNTLHAVRNSEYTYCFKFLDKNDYNSPISFEKFQSGVKKGLEDSYESLEKIGKGIISSRKHIEKIISRSSKKKSSYNEEEIYSRFREYCEQLPKGFVPEFPNQVKEYGINHPSSMVIGYQGLRDKNRKYSVYYRICLDKTANECYIYSTIMRTGSDIDLEDSEGVYSFWFTENNGEPISYPKFENRVAQGLVETWMPLPRESEKI